MRRLLPAGLLVVALAGCGAASPEDELARRADALTVAANDRDAAAVRSAARELADAVTAQSEGGELEPERASSLLALADALYEQADLVDPQVQARLRAEQQAQAAQEQAARERAARQAAEERAAQERAEREAAERRAEDDRRKGEGEGKGQGKDEGKDEGGGDDDAAQDAADDAADAAEDAAKDAEDSGEE